MRKVYVFFNIKLFTLYKLFKMSVLIFYAFFSNLLMAGGQVTPMLAEISPMGSGAQVRIILENNGLEKPLTFVVEPLMLELDYQGNESLTPAEEDLLVIPPTVVVKPGKAQTVLVQYIGDPTVQNSRSYRVIFKQEPINYNAGSNGGKSAKFLLGVNYNALINLTPENSFADPHVNSINTSSKGYWNVEVENKGSRYARMSMSRWLLGDASGRQVEISGKQLMDKLDGSLVLPHSVRVFKMAPIENFNVKHINIKML